MYTRMINTATLTLLNIAKRVLITRFGNKLGINATRFVNHVFNISESRFEGYPVRRHDCISINPGILLQRYVVQIIVSQMMCVIQVQSRITWELTHANRRHSARLLTGTTWKSFGC